jgi:hypothetical protein
MVLDIRCVIIEKLCGFVPLGFQGSATFAKSVWSACLPSLFANLVCPTCLSDRFAQPVCPACSPILWVKAVATSNALRPGVRLHMCRHVEAHVPLQFHRQFFGNILSKGFSNSFGYGWSNALSLAMASTVALARALSMALAKNLALASAVALAMASAMALPMVLALPQGWQCLLHICAQLWQRL